MLRENYLKKHSKMKKAHLNKFLLKINKKHKMLLQLWLRRTGSNWSVRLGM